MGRFCCHCGHVLSDNADGECISLYSEKTYENAAEHGIFSFPDYEVWICKKCGRIYIFDEHKMDESPIEYIKDRLFYYEDDDFPDEDFEDGGKKGDASDSSPQA